MNKAKYVVFVTEAKVADNGLTLSDTWVTTREQFREKTWSPEIEIAWCAPLTVIGKTYKEKKESLRNFIKDFMYYDCGGLSWGELAIIEGFIEQSAKQYGLLNELRSEGIIS